MVEPCLDVRRRINEENIKELLRNTKIRVFNNFTSVLLYGPASWKAIKRLINELQTSLSRCLKNVLRIWSVAKYVENALKCGIQLQWKYLIKTNLGANKNEEMEVDLQGEGSATMQARWNA